MQDVNWVALSVFVVLFGFITWLGYAAANWRRGDLDQLHEWGLGGRRFGTIVTWFLIGGGSLYGLHLHCRAGARVWGGRRRVLHRSLHGHRLPDSVPGVSAHLAGLPLAASPCRATRPCTRCS